MKYDYIEENKSGNTAIVMLHGMFGHASNWDGIIKPLSRKYRIIALNLPYLKLNKQDCNVQYLSDYVLKFADEHNLSKAIYTGNSLGGHIALDIAIKRNDRIDKLILTGSSGLFERSYENDLQIHPTKAYMRKKIEEIFFDKSYVTEEIVEEAYNALLNRKHKLNIVRLSKSAKEYNLKNSLYLIKCPTLLVWGREDTITPPSVAMKFKRYISDSRLEFIPNCCHAPMMERPRDFGRIVMEFLSAEPAVENTSSKPSDDK